MQPFIIQVSNIDIFAKKRFWNENYKVYANFDDF